MRTIKEIKKEQAKIQKMLKTYLEEENRAQRKVEECYKKCEKLEREKEKLKLSHYNELDYED
jgi:predicted transcriptional regulator